ncbi:uncharacterized protein LOC113290048 [Papaver somniferum]|uniref:uncharacterized protein LOC113290048 n=1 Tax=Papaver somniferum TaxID=3469 RepID=UPI000E6F9583|nr:uncharacterized protein LOC113290048 [Papaver somniferum]
MFGKMLQRDIVNFRSKIFLSHQLFSNKSSYPGLSPIDKVIDREKTFELRRYLYLDGEYRLCNMVASSSFILHMSLNLMGGYNGKFRVGVNGHITYCVLILRWVPMGEVLNAHKWCDQMTEMWGKPFLILQANYGLLDEVLVFQFGLLGVYFFLLRKKAYTPGTEWFTQVIKVVNSGGDCIRLHDFALKDTHWVSCG